MLLHKYMRACERNPLWNKTNRYSKAHFEKCSRPFGNSSWFHVTRFGHKPKFTSTPSGTRHEGDPNAHQNQAKPEKHNQDVSFETFKRHIDADPYDALFGSRLDRLMQRAEKSMWSYLTQSLESMEPVPNAPPKTSGDGRPSGKAPKSDKSVLSPVEESLVREQKIQINTPFTDNETSVRYEYDPILMRKVPKLDSLSHSTPEPNSDPRHDSGSHFAIPVKKSQKISLASSHRVKGPAGSEEERPGSKDHISCQISDDLEGVSKFNTTTGRQAKEKCSNQIDSAFSSTPQLTPHHSGAQNSSAALKTSMPDAATDAPLFSGTTYEQKAKSILTRRDDKAASWLSREGFAASTQSDATQSKPSPSEPRPLGSNSKINKIQPSLDRVTATQHSFQVQLPKSEASLATNTPLNRHLTPTEASVPETEHLGRNDGHYSTVQATQDAKTSHLRTKRSLAQDRGIGFGCNYTINGDMPKPASGSEKPPASVPNTASSQEVESYAKVQVPIQNVESKISFTLPQKTSTQKPTSVAEKDSKLSANVGSHGLRTLPKLSKTQNPEERAKLEAEALEQQKNGQSRTAMLQRAAEQARFEAEKIQNRLRALIPELKRLYEDRYGMVTADHRQEPLAGSKPSESRNVDPTGTSEVGVTKSSHSKVAHGGHGRGDWWQKRKMRRQENVASSNKREPDAGVSDVVQQDQQQYDYTEPEETRARNLSYLKEGQQLTENSDKTKLSPVSSYRVLAYDKSTRRITIADTASSFVHVNEEPLHPTEVLSRLNRAAKFLPYLEDLQNEGYEIVSGHGDILIFKRTETAEVNGLEKPPPATSTCSAQRRSPSPRSKIRRREPVFSGARRTWQQEDRNGSSHEGNIARLAKHVLLTGTVTAGLLYGIGAIAEAMESDGREYRTKGRPGIYSTQDSR